MASWSASSASPCIRSAMAWTMGARQLCARHSIVAAGFRARCSRQHVDAPGLGVAAGEADDVHAERACRRSGSTRRTCCGSVRPMSTPEPSCELSCSDKRLRELSAGDDVPSIPVAMMSASLPGDCSIARPARTPITRLAAIDVHSGHDHCRALRQPACDFVRRAQQSVRHLLVEHAGEGCTDVGAQRALALDLLRDLRIDRHLRFDCPARLARRARRRRRPSAFPARTS